MSEIDFEKRRIFSEIDNIISQCKSNIPVPFLQSKFFRMYKKLKKDEKIDEENN